MALEEIRRERIAKIEKLQQPAYPADTRRTHHIAEVLQQFDALSQQATHVTIAGRVLARREHGSTLFIDLADGEGRMQAYLKRDTLGDRYGAFLATTDIGDIIEITGKPFLTKREEPTLMAHEWRMLAKSLRPLPEKWHGLKDVEERSRRRYLDLLMNKEVLQRFSLRSKLTSAIRKFFDGEGFLEVETPMFHPIPGGTIAKPFVTHHNALDIDLYLRIAPELYLKRLLIGGLERIYEIGKSFRNEGIDATHNPEFTMMEWYAAYWDEEVMMQFVERLLQKVVLAVLDGAEFSFDGNRISFEGPFARVTFEEVLRRYALILEYEKETRETLHTHARRFGIEVPPHESKGKIADEIFKKVCRPRLTDPTFVTEHPLDISPLAKRFPDRENVRRFQVIAGGLEFVNGWAELNDPLDQRMRFEEQDKRRQLGDEEAHAVDEDFLEAMEYGMPPTAGVGMSIDRLTMLLTDTKNIREVILFPTLRPK